MICPKCNGDGFFKGYQKQTLSHYTLTCSWCMGTGAGVPLVKYAGIGARVTPKPIALQMENLAMRFALKGLVLRSGRGKRPVDAGPDTDSADLAFERGCDAVAGRKVIRSVGYGDDRLEHAARYHPNWAACNEHARALHARNSLIMCGDWLDDPVAFVVCWTEGGKVKGGTGQSLRIAAAPEYNIPVFNLAIAGNLEALEQWLSR